MKSVDVAILGAGAAGMMCAIEAGRRGRSVILIDHAKSAGEKIRISGGGRCNFTNLNIGREKFLSRNPYFALSALKRYSQFDFIEMVRASGISYHEKTLGQLFCDGSAKEIIAMLLSQMRGAGVDLRLQTSIKFVRLDGGKYTVETDKGSFQADSVVVATGGKSIPKMGATGLGYKLAEQFNIPVVETRPALVPLTFAEQELQTLAALSGVAVTTSVSCNGVTFDESMLFTHRGLSGPSILQISSYWKEGDKLSINLGRGLKAPIADLLKAQRQEAGRMSIKNAVARFFPEKLAQLLIDQAALVGNLADQNNATIDRFSELVENWVVTPVGSEGYRTAEVTLGGVDTDALHARTMEAKMVPGLYFIGEVVDVTGWLGGYNFQWAWSSGWVAGQVA